MKFNDYLVKEKEYALLGAQKQAEALKQSGQNIINLTVGDPKDSTFEPLKEKIISEVKKMAYSQYPKASGDTEYLAAVSQWAKKEYGVDYHPDTDIISCNGSKEAIFTVPIVFNWKDKHIAIPSLSYPVYAMSAGLLGIPIEYLPLSKESNFLPDLESIPETTWERCGLFWINSPHNPTTAIATHDYFSQLLDRAKHYNFLVCSDECYNALYYNEKPASVLEFPDSQHWLAFRSLSKRSHMTGFRVGALITKNTVLMGYLKKMRASMGVGTPTFIQKAAIDAWLDTDHSKNNVSAYKEKRALLLPVLRQKGFDVFGSEAGFYLWFSHKKFPTSASLCEYFASANIMITPGTAFGSDGEGYARMVYCDTLSTIKEAAERITAL